MIVSNIPPEHDPRLIIRQTDEIHEQIGTHLDKLRRERGIPTSHERSDVATFPVTDLIEIEPGRDLKTHPLQIKDIKPLRQEIVAKIHPENWLENGGQGRLEIVIRTPVTGQNDHTLVVFNSSNEIQQEVEEFLNKKRRQKTDQNTPIPSPP